MRRESPRLDEVWIACSSRMDLPIRRGGEAFVHFDGRVLWIAADADLDEDDTLAQLIFHEICHLAVQGLARRHVPDWGLDSASDRDRLREEATVRLQAHLAGLWGLRGVLFPTTEVRGFYEALPARALGPVSDPSSALAHVGAARIGREPFAPAVADALTATLRLVAPPLHKSGWPRVAAGDDRTCGTCAWRTEGGLCRQGRARVAATEPACVRHEPALDCFACGACCRGGFDVVPLGAREAARLPTGWIHELAGSRELVRIGDRCAALTGPDAGPYRCTVYADRPRACRDLEPGGRHCLTARRRVGLSG